MANMAKLMLQEAANVNSQDADGWYVINLDILGKRMRYGLFYFKRSEGVVLPLI